MRVVIPVVLVLVAGAVWWALQPAPRATVVPQSASTASPNAPRVEPEALRSEPRTPISTQARQAPSRAPAKAPSSDADSPRARRAQVQSSAQAVLDKVAVQAPPTKAPGVMSPEAVRFAVSQSKPGVVDCYTQALKTSPDLAGRLTMKFTVHVEGGVGTLRDAEVIEDGLANPFLGMCALGAVAKVEFEAEEDGIITVHYPFTLSPGETK